MLNLKAEILADLEELAQQYELDANEVLTQALKTYRRRLEETKIEMEKKQFLAQHSRLKDTYLGQFVAMHHGQVVDHGLDFETLHQRIRHKFGREAILIRRVEEEPDPPLMIRSPKVRWSNPT